MSTSTKCLRSNDPLDQYVFDHSIRFTAEQLELLEYVQTLPGRKVKLVERDNVLVFVANVQRWLGSVDEAQFFQVLIRLINAKRTSKMQSKARCFLLK
jgi:hypothetical protein